MSDRRRRPATPPLFARKGEASAAGFIQPERGAQRRFGQPRRRRADTMPARMTAIGGFVAAATMVVVLATFGVRDDGGARGPPGRADAASAALGQPSHRDASAPDGPPAATSAMFRKPVADGEPPADRPASADQGAAVAPVSVRLDVAKAPSKGGGAVKPPRAAKGGYRVQLVSLSSAAAVRREWKRLKAAHGDALRGFGLTVEPNPAGSLYRLQVGPVATREAARALCARIGRPPKACFVLPR